MSNVWSDFTKRLVLIVTLIVLMLILYRFSVIIPPLVVTALLAYLLNPAVELVCKHTRLSRTWTILVIYFLLLIILSLGPAIFVPTLIEQVQEIDVHLQDTTDAVQQFFAEPLVFMGYSIDLRDAYQEISGALQNLLSSVATHTVSILVNLASIVLWVIFVVVVSFYLLKDAERLSQAFEGLVPPAYQMEFRQLRKEIGGIWNAFLRGQLILCAVVGVVVTIVLAILGVRNALVLGLVAGLLEVIPNVGPTLAAVPAVLIAYFQGSTYLPLTNGWFALLVIAAYVVFQQVENNYLVPRVIGRSLNLHPLVVIIGAIAGGILAGVLGILLAAPTLATLRVLAQYVYCKLLDLEPFVQELPQEACEMAAPQEEPSA